MPRTCRYAQNQPYWFHRCAEYELFKVSNLIQVRRFCLFVPSIDRNLNGCRNPGKTAIWAPKLKAKGITRHA